MYYLSPARDQVYDLCGRGLFAVEIAIEMNISKAAVHKHISRLLAGKYIKVNQRVGRSIIYEQTKKKYSRAEPGLDPKLTPPSSGMIDPRHLEPILRPHNITVTYKIISPPHLPFHDWSNDWETKGTHIFEWKGTKPESFDVRPDTTILIDGMRFHDGHRGGRSLTVTFYEDPRPLKDLPLDFIEQLYRKAALFGNHLQNETAAKFGKMNVNIKDIHYALLNTGLTEDELKEAMEIGLKSGGFWFDFSTGEGEAEVKGLVGIRNVTLMTQIGDHASKTSHNEDRLDEHDILLKRQAKEAREARELLITSTSRKITYQENVNQELIENDKAIMKALQSDEPDPTPDTAQASISVDRHYMYG